MIEYTLEELELLRDMLIEADRQDLQSTIESKLKHYIGQTVDWARPAITDTLTKTLANRVNFLENTLYKMIGPAAMLIPLEQVPLYINDPDICIRTTAAWRLKIGK